MNRYARGQALIESTIFLPLFLFVLFGVIWAAKTGVLNERVQLAVRYSGLVSDQVSPYTQYSLYTVYNNLAGNALVPDPCTPPLPAMLSGGGPLPVPSSAPFWQPDSNSATVSCAQSLNVYSASAFTRSAIVMQTNSSISATSAVPQYLGDTLGAAALLSANTNFFKAPDLASDARCFPDVGTAVANSLYPKNDTTSVAVSTAPLAPPFDATPVAANPSCPQPTTATHGS